ncbi:MAG TPA: hypothetical protein VMT89_18565 [Candidatus Acidoferrales bacterium]|nr:hypothetical protein [Candidatus Acidoferrales bacterium]
MTVEEREEAPEGAVEIAFKGFGNLDGDDWFTETLLRTTEGRFFFAIDSARSSVHQGASFEEWVSDDEAADWLARNGFLDELKELPPVGNSGQKSTVLGKSE